MEDADLHVAAVTLGEIQAGIELTRDQDGAKAVEIEAWLDLVAQTYNVLLMDSAAFRTWAKLMHRRSDSLYEDAMIAAIRGSGYHLSAVRNSGATSEINTVALPRMPASLLFVAIKQQACRGAWHHAECLQIFVVQGLRIATQNSFRGVAQGARLHPIHTEDST